MRVTVLGAGVAGLTCAVRLAERGAIVSIYDLGERLGAGAASWFAGGMLAPWCELESAEPIVGRFGDEAIGWWAEHFTQTVRNGSLVVAHGRDVAELSRFARRTQNFEWADGNRIAELEPDLAGRFHKGLFFPGEAHLDPRAALAALIARLDALGIRIHWNATAFTSPGPVLDCRGLAARDTLADLRGVKGEMLLIRSRELTLSRPIRLLHPRIPVYIVPRDDGLFMVGATMIESDDQRRISVRSLLDLLAAAYSVHPAFGEAEVVETGTGVRPSFPDNLPRLRWRGTTLHVNGFYRHGFLMAPALARMAAAAVLDGEFFGEVMDENSAQRQRA
jgi:glycine oxidase